MSETKKALLDTDFLFKTYLAQDNRKEPLTDLVLAFQGYDFYCHEKIVEELGTHAFNPDPRQWLQAKIDEGAITCYSDEMIVDELEQLFAANASNMYYFMLKRSCDTCGSSFFNCHYRPLIDLQTSCAKDEFIRTLSICDAQIPNGSSMGENKSFVLAQLLQLKYPGKVVVLCSDDAKARRRISSLDRTLKSLSVLSVFQKLMKMGVEKDIARQYYDSLCNYYSRYGQRTMKVWTKMPSKRISIELMPLFEEIFADKFEILTTGDLRYKE